MNMGEGNGSKGYDKEINETSEPRILVPDIVVEPVPVILQYSPMNG